MAEILNFAALSRPFLPVVMRDEEKTEIRVTPSTLGQVSDLLGHFDDLKQAILHPDTEQRQAIYDSAAALISHNRDGLTVTGEDLRKKYGLDLEDLTIFFNAYVEFLQEVASEKNG